jgi:tRNA pseudouridine38-40 synthase
VKETRRVAVKLAYNGSEFYGFQRQPNKATVEGSLIRALESIGAIRSTRECGLRSSSRTDRGVSALGNVVSFKTDFSLRSLCSAANSELDGAWLYSAVHVEDGFNPRWAGQRWYRYFLPVASQDATALRRAAQFFVGTHDFSRFARADGRDPIRTIDSITITESERFFAIDFKAESYLWNMVRRMVWHMDAVACGVIDGESSPLGSGSSLRRTGLAPAEYLLLMDVDCGIEFPRDPKAVKKLREEFQQRVVDLSVTREITDLFLEKLGSDDPR